MREKSTKYSDFLGFVMEILPSLEEYMTITAFFHRTVRARKSMIGRQDRKPLILDRNGLLTPAEI